MTLIKPTKYIAQLTTFYFAFLSGYEGLEAEERGKTSLSTTDWL